MYLIHIAKMVGMLYVYTIHKTIDGELSESRVQELKWSLAEHLARRQDDRWNKAVTE